MLLRLGLAAVHWMRRYAAGTTELHMVIRCCTGGLHGPRDGHHQLFQYCRRASRARIPFLSNLGHAQSEEVVDVLHTTARDE